MHNHGVTAAKILVLGADGLLGNHIVRVLLERGHTVRVFLQPGRPTPTLDELELERNEGDLLDDPAALNAAVDGCDYVIHSAAITDMWAAPELVWQVNHEGTRKVIDACKIAGIQRLVFVGSASSFAFGPLDAPGDESSPFPAEYKGIPYMESKHRAREEVLEACQTGALDAVVVCPTFMLGDYDSRPSSGELTRQFVQRQLKAVPPGGRNFAHARDVAIAAVNALDREKVSSGSTYILGGANLTYLDYFGRAARIAGLDAPRRTLPPWVLRLAGAGAETIGKLTGHTPPLNRRLARLATYGTWYSSQKAITELDMPQTPVEFGIEDTLHALYRYGHLQRPEQDFAGKVALITGGSRGTGYAIAAELARRGASVVISARGEQRLMDSVAKLRRQGFNAEGIVGDVGNRGFCERMVQFTNEKFGRLDVVVANAGVSMRGHFAKTDPAVIEQVVQTNLFGCLHVARAAINHLVATGGSLTFVGSVAGIFGLPGAAPYCASKMALTGLTESLRCELIPKGVHVGVIYLGFTEHDPDKRILDADGAPALPDRPAHHSQNRAAQLIVGMIKQRKKRLVMTPVGHLSWWIHRLAPGIVERAVIFAQTSQWAIFKRFS